MGMDFDESLAETLEFTAKTIIKARLLGGDVRFLSDEELAIEERRPASLEEFDAGPPASDENEVRRSRLFLWFRFACVFLVMEILAWLVEFATG